MTIQRKQEKEITSVFVLRLWKLCGLKKGLNFSLLCRRREKKSHILQIIPRSGYLKQCRKYVPLTFCLLLKGTLGEVEHHFEEIYFELRLVNAVLVWYICLLFRGCVMFLINVEYSLHPICTSRSKILVCLLYQMGQAC